MQFPVFLELRRSRRLTLSLIAVHLAAAVSVLLLPLPAWACAVLPAPLVVSLYRSLRRPAITGLRLGADGNLECLVADGAGVAAEVLPDTTVFRSLVVLRLRLAETRRTHHVVVLGDSIGVEQLRVLRLWLRWKAKVSGAAPAP